MPAKAQADIVYGFTTILRSDPAFHAYWIMNNVLGQYGIGGRIGMPFSAVATNVTGFIAAFSVALGPQDFPFLGGRALIDPFSIIRTVLRGVNGGVSAWNINIPFDPSLAGVALYFQANVLVALGPPDVFEFSNGLETVLSP